MRTKTRTDRIRLLHLLNNLFRLLAHELKCLLLVFTGIINSQNLEKFVLIVLPKRYDHCSQQASDCRFGLLFDAINLLLAEFALELTEQ